MASIAITQYNPMILNLKPYRADNSSSSRIPNKKSLDAFIFSIVMNYISALISLFWVVGGALITHLKETPAT